MISTNRYFICSLVFSILCSNTGNAQVSYSKTDSAYVHLLEGFINQIEKSEKKNKYVDYSVSSDSSEQNRKTDSLIRINNNKDTAEKIFLLNTYFISGNDSLLALEHRNKDSLLKAFCPKFFPYYVHFANFVLGLGQNAIANLIIEPLRLYPDKFYYEHFEPYQRENSLVFFDKRYPNKSLGVVLCVPPGKIYRNSPPRILGWTLVFANGRFHFVDVYGSDETENVIFNFIQPPPKYPINIKKELGIFHDSSGKVDSGEEKEKDDPLVRPFDRN